MSASTRQEEENLVSGSGAAVTTDAVNELDGDTTGPSEERSWRFTRFGVWVFGVAPVLAVALTTAGAVLWWQNVQARSSDTARTESMASVRDTTIAMLSYDPEKVDTQLRAAGELLAGDFKQSYAQLTNDVVIPGARQKKITSAATVSAVASVSASPDRAVNLVFVNQTVTVGNEAPTGTTSAIKVEMEKIDNRWLIVGFDPI